MTVTPISTIVPSRKKDAEWVWGIDPSATKGAAFCFYNVYTGKFQTNRVIWFGKAANPAFRLMECRAACIRFAEACSGHFPPLTIAIERPIGRPNPPLMMHAGVIAEAVGTGTNLPPWFVNTSEWRASCTDLPSRPSKEQVMEWATGRGWHGGTDDEAEAVGIAFHASALWMKRLIA